MALALGDGAGSTLDLALGRQESLWHTNQAIPAAHLLAQLLRTNNQDTSAHGMMHALQEQYFLNS